MAGEAYPSRPAIPALKLSKRPLSADPCRGRDRRVTQSKGNGGTKKRLHKSPPPPGPNRERARARRFGCGVVSDAPGLMASNDFYVRVDANKNRVMPKVAKGSSAHVRHRRWLKELSRQRTKAIDAHEQNDIVQAERLQRFHERAEKQRADVRATLPAAGMVCKRAEKPFVIEAPCLNTESSLVGATYSCAKRRSGATARESPVEPLLPKARPGTDVMSGDYFDRKFRMCEPESRQGTASDVIASRAQSPFKLNMNSREKCSTSELPKEYVTNDENNCPVLPTLSRKQTRNRPPWARTEDGQRVVEEVEVDELLEFASNLDFDEYIDDLEVQENLTAVKERVEKLRAEQEEAEEEEARRLEKAEMHHLERIQSNTEVLNTGGHENTTSGCFEVSARSERSSKLSPEVSGTVSRSAPSRDEAFGAVHSPHSAGNSNNTARSRSSQGSQLSGRSEPDNSDTSSSFKEASDLLKASKSLRSVHSKRSMKKVVQNLQMSDRVGFQALPVVGAGKESNEHPAIEEPRKVCDPEALGTISLVQRKKNLKDIEPGTVAYLYRHPGV